MLNRPLVSVILPTYNRRSIIKRSISSVFAQTYDNLELVIVDDGSTDGTKQYVKSNFDQNRINYLEQSNKGVSSARNRGCSVAQGKYLAFIDSDDEWREAKLSKQMDFLEKYPEAGLVFCDATIVSPGGIVSDKPELIPHYKDMVYGLREILADPYLGVPTVIMTKKLFEEVGGFDESLSTAEDIDLFLRVALKSRIGYLHDKLVRVHKTTGSLSSFVIDEQDDIAAYEDNIFVFRRFIDRNLQSLKDYGCDIDRVMFNLYLSYSRCLLAMGKCSAARRKLGKAHQYKMSLNSLYLLAKSYWLANG